MKRIIVLISLLLLSSTAQAFYSLVQDESTGLAQRRTIRFTGASVLCTDDAVNERTTCAVSSSNVVTATLPVAISSDVVSITGLSSLGAANQIPGTNAAGTAWEYKTLTAVANETNIAHTANTVTIGIVDPLIATKGGTGLAVYVLGDVLYSDAANSLARLAGSTSATKNFLSQTGTGTISAAPAWVTLTDADIPNTITLTNITQIDNRAISDTTGTLAVTRGGVGITAITGKGYILSGTAANTLAEFAPGANALCLKTDSAQASGLIWEACGAAAGDHVILSTSHTDTLATGTLIQGDILVANATPKWARVAIGGANTVLHSNGTTASWQALLDADIPPDIAIDGTNNVTWVSVNKTGSSLANLATRAISDTTGTLAVARGGTDLTSLTAQGMLAISATDTIARFAISGVNGDCLQTDSATATGLAWGACGSGSAHNLLSATHSDTLAASVVLGDIVTGNATPKWSRLAGNITATKQFLSQTGNGTISALPAWAALVDADIPDTITLTNITQITNKDINDTTGILPLSRGGHGANVAIVATNTVWSGPPSGANDAPTFRALVDNDIPNILHLDDFTNAQHTHQNATNAGQLDHGLALTGLGDDDHTQYALGGSGVNVFHVNRAANFQAAIDSACGISNNSTAVVQLPPTLTVSSTITGNCGGLGKRIHVRGPSFITCNTGATVCFQVGGGAGDTEEARWWLEDLHFEKGGVVREAGSVGVQIRYVAIRGVTTGLSIDGFDVAIRWNGTNGLMQAWDNYGIKIAHGPNAVPPNTAVHLQAEVGNIKFFGGNIGALQRSVLVDGAPGSGADSEWVGTMFNNCSTLAGYACIDIQNGMLVFMSQLEIEGFYPLWKIGAGGWLSLTSITHSGSPFNSAGSYAIEMNGTSIVQITGGRINGDGVGAGGAIHVTNNAASGGLLEISGADITKGNAAAAIKSEDTDMPVNISGGTVNGINLVGGPRVEITGVDSRSRFTFGGAADGWVTITGNHIENGINITDGDRIIIANNTIWGISDYCVRLAGSAIDINIIGNSFHGWNEDASGDACIDVIAGGTQDLIAVRGNMFWTTVGTIGIQCSATAGVDEYIEGNMLGGATVNGTCTTNLNNN